MPTGCTVMVRRSRPTSTGWSVMAPWRKRSTTGKSQSKEWQVRIAPSVQTLAHPLSLMDSNYPMNGRFHMTADFLS